MMPLASCEPTDLFLWLGMQGDIADEEFSQYFSQFGEIEDCVVSFSSPQFQQLFVP